MNDDDDGVGVGGGIVTDFVHRRSPIWNAIWLAPFCFQAKFLVQISVSLFVVPFLLLLLLLGSHNFTISRTFHVITASLGVYVRARRVN